MFIRYTCSGNSVCYFYDKNKEPIKPLGESKYWAFIITDVDIEFFNFNPSSKEFYRLNEYKLNENYFFENKKIKFKLSTILKKEQKSLYDYEGKSLFESLEAPNTLPNNGDSIFRENYFKNNNENIYLSKYDFDYHPVLSISPPNFVFKEKKYQYTSDGEASKLYEAFRDQNKISNTLFLKPYCRQWNTEKIILTTPGEYSCTYKYDTRELTMNWTTYDDSGNSVKKTKTYNNVPHVITICCQGAGSGGEDGHPAASSGHGGSAGGFIAGNCFLGDKVETFKIKVGQGGKSRAWDESSTTANSGQSSYVYIVQTIDLTDSKNKKNPTFINYNGFEYTTLECGLSFVAEGGKTSVSGNGRVSINVKGSYQDGDITKTDQNSKSKYFLSSLFYKILFDAKGGKGGLGIYGNPSKDEESDAQGSGPSFTTITDSTFRPNIKAEWSSNNTYLLEEKAHIHGNNNLKSSLILEGSSLQESLYSEDVYPSLKGGGSAGWCYNAFHPGGAGGGSSLFGVGGSGGSKGHDNGYDGKLGAGGGGGKGGVEPGNGGKGGDGAVWLLW